MDIGHIIDLVVQSFIVLAGVYAMILRSSWTGKGLTDEIRQMKLELKELKEIVVTQAVQAKEIVHLTSQFMMLQRTVEDLRRGDGWVQGHHRTVDREYPGK